MTKKVYEEIECAACGVWFTPSRSNVKYCSDCRRHSDQIVKQMKRNTQRNINRYGYGKEPKKIQNICKECGKDFITYLRPKDFCSKECEDVHFVKHTSCAYCKKPMTMDDDIKDVKNGIWLCSDKCKEGWAWMIARKNGTVRTCPNCGKDFIKKGTYCSRDCYLQFTQKRKAEAERRKAAGLKLCPVCGKEFSGDEICCSTECLQKKKATEPHAMRKCSACGKVFDCPVSDMFSIEYSFCSSECEKKFPDIVANLVAKNEKLQKEKRKKVADDRFQEYISKNGLCSICKTSYMDCERMRTNFRCYPDGSSCKGSLVVKCPKFTR